MARRRHGREDFESKLHATRARLGAQGLHVVPGPTTIPPHRHHASEIDVTAFGLLASEQAQLALEEHDEEKLARSGVQPMLGNLDMNHFDINNILNAEIEEDLNFTGGAGEATVNGVRVVHFVGDDDDGEARIDGLERVIFNDEPTKSVIENPSAIQFNIGVEPGEDTTYLEGQLSHSEIEKTLQLDVGQDGGVYFQDDEWRDYPEVRGTLGWGFVRWKNEAGNVQPLRVLFSTDAGSRGQPPTAAGFFDLALYDQFQPWFLPPFGVSMNQDEGEGHVWVMHRGIMRGYPMSQVDGGVSAGNILWASGNSGQITAIRPEYTEAPLIKVGRVIGTDGDLMDVEIDLMVMPRAEAFPGSVGRRWSWLMGD